jgi:hypothetical protein
VQQEKNSKTNITYFYTTVILFNPLMPRVFFIANTLISGFLQNVTNKKVS